MYLKSTKDRLYKLMPYLNNKVDLNRMFSLNSRTYAELTSFFYLFELDTT